MKWPPYMTPAENVAAQLRGADILDLARKLITPPGRLTRGAEARNAKGEPVRPSHWSAVYWCVIGAIHRESHGEVDFFAVGILSGIVDDDVARWGDMASRMEIINTMRSGARELRECAKKQTAKRKEA